MLGGSFHATQFYADIEGHPDDPPVRRALEELDYFTSRSPCWASTRPIPGATESRRCRETPHTGPRAAAVAHGPVTGSRRKTLIQTIGFLISEYHDTAARVFATRSHAFAHAAARCTHPVTGARTRIARSAQGPHYRGMKTDTAPSRQTHRTSKGGRHEDLQHHRIATAAAIPALAAFSTVGPVRRRRLPILSDPGTRRRHAELRPRRRHRRRASKRPGAKERGVDIAELSAEERGVDIAELSTQERGVDIAELPGTASTSPSSARTRRRHRRAQRRRARRRYRRAQRRRARRDIAELSAEERGVDIELSRAQRRKSVAWISPSERRRARRRHRRAERRRARRGYRRAERQRARRGYRN